jgi:hypothetical protein
LGNRLDFLSHTLKFANDAYNFSREVRRFMIGIRNRFLMRQFNPQRNSNPRKLKLDPFLILQRLKTNSWVLFSATSKLNLLSLFSKNLFMIFPLPILPNSIGLKKLEGAQIATHPFADILFFTAFHFFRAYVFRQFFCWLAFLSNVKKCCL